MRFTRLDQWLTWQDSLHPQSIDLGLERCTEVAVRMGILDHGYQVISIAGTNGKGSSAAMLDLIYLDAGYSVGTYTSPHLVTYNERIRVNGKYVSDAVLCRAFEKVDQARGEISLTYFEFGTLAALEIFGQSELDVAVLEVGLGGRLDAVNVMDPDVALITSIGLDHQDWLGNTRELIGREKAGIMRARHPVVCSDTDPPRSLIEHAKQLGAELYRAGIDYRCEHGDSSWDWFYGESRIEGLPLTGLLHPALIWNGSGVLMVIELLQETLPVPLTVIKSSIGKADVPGRFQVVQRQVPLILDVAHNQPAAEKLVENLRDLELTGTIHMVIGMLEDKDHAAVLGTLAEITGYWYLVTLTGSRGLDATILNNSLKSTGIHKEAALFDTIAEAISAAEGRVGPADAIVITGSFLTVGAAMQYLGLHQG